jgi:hypothetical protein
VPLDWAATQSNLGNALVTLGERESGTAHLTEAVARLGGVPDSYSIHNGRRRRRCHFARYRCRRTSSDRNSSALERRHGRGRFTGNDLSTIARGEWLTELQHIVMDKQERSKVLLGAAAAALTAALGLAFLRRA